MKKISLLTFAIMLMSLWLTAQTPCSNLVTNGNFEATTPGFTSVLAVNASCVINTYNVTTNFTLKCPNYPSRTDHTTGTGKFLVVQNSTAVNVWQNTVTVTPNTPYTFSFWVANGVTNAMTYAMIVDGVNVHQISVTQATPTWQKYTFSGFCPAGVTSLAIAIKQITFGEAYVYGIDDVSFISCSDAPCIGCTSSLASANLISNGSFTNGDIGFTTGLTYDNNIGGGASCGAGRYGVYTNFTSFCTGWPSLLDHTNNSPAASRKYMTIDGYDFLALLPVWQSPVNLTANTDYCFSFWWASVYPTSLQSFPISIDIVTPNGFTVVNNLGTQTIAQSPAGVWVQKTITWNSGSLSGLQYLAIRQPTPNGFSDWGIDDICFTKKSPPPCNAEFTFQNIDNCGNIQFTNTSTLPDLTRPSYSWNFGDGNSSNNTSALQSPSHQFTACGTYNVCLIINGSGCIDTICHTVTVSDITPPVARCKPGIGVILNANCQYNVTSAFVDNGSTDNCQIKSLVVNPAILFGCGNTTVTLTATDWCNNRSTCTMGIQTIETVPPVITCPPTATVTCTKDTIPSVTGTATATDNCPGVITFTHSDIVSGNMPCDATIRRTWTATDACGNSSSCVQSIIVRDNVPPVAICKPGVGVILDANCMYTVTPAFVDGGSTDNCQIQSMSVSPNKITGCGLTTVTFTVTDLCNNKSTCTMGIQTIETVPPVIVCPPNATVTCDNVAQPSLTGTATATDNCPGAITITYLDVVSGIMPCEGVIRRTWTARDSCGNTSSCVQTISVRDNVPPIITNCPTNQTVSTNGGVCYYTFPTPLVITATDCDPNPVITCVWTDPNGVVLPLTAQTQFPKGVNSIKCTARDKCGNISKDCFFTLTVVDNQPPTITCPLSISVVGSIVAPSTLCKATVNGIAPIITDNCPMWNVTYTITGSTTASGSTDASGTMFMQGISTVTYTVTDMGGNKATCSFTINVKCEPCVASFTYAISGSCNNIQFTNQSGGTQPLSYIWTFGDPNSGTTNNTSTLPNPIHQFTGCGTYNVCLYLTTGDGCRDTFCRQIIIDNTAPNMTCPPNLTVACIRDTATSITGKPVVFDNCPGTVTVTYSDVITGTLPCNGIIKRTWTARDFCGNTATCVQTITVNDITPPKIICPQSYTVNTNAGACYFTGALTPTTATDNCDPNPTITCSLLTPTSSILITPQTQFPKGINNISCIARDNCGNTSTACTFTLTVVDNEKPTITCPLSISVVGTYSLPPVQCKAIVNGLAPTVTDNCPMWSVGYTISGATTVTNGISDASGTMFMQGISTVTYTVTDMGGNKATCSFTVTVRCDASQPDFKGFSCGQAIISCFSGFIPGTSMPDPNGPVIAQVDFREHALAPLGVNWTAVSSSSSKIYHAADWIGQKMGQVFGVTIDAQNNVYASGTTIYGIYMPAPLTNAAFGNVYKIDAITGNVSVLATLPQNLANPAGLGDVWYDAPRTRLLASNFYNGKIYEINPVTGSFSVLYDYSITSSATTIGTPSAGFIARGKRVWAIATDANYLYFSVWNEDRGAGRNSTTVNNEIRRVQLVSGVPTGASTPVHSMSNLLTTSTQIYSSPVSDIQFSATGNMLVAERSMDFDYGDSYSNTSYQAHESRVIELYPPNTWSSEKLYYVGNPYDVGGGPTYHANSSGGADYGYESFNPSGSPLPSKCDSMVWTTGDALRFPGFNGSIIDGSPLGTPCGGGVNDYVYGLAGMRASGNSNNSANTSTFVKTNSIYIDVDNNICRNTKTRIGDIDVFKCGCFSQPSTCDSIAVTSAPLNTGKDSCCFKITVQNQKPNFFDRIQLCTSNGVSISSLSTLNGWGLIAANATMLTVAPPGGFPNTVPVASQDFIKICLSNYINVPNQQVIVKYLKFNGTEFEAVCFDTLNFNCTQKPKCLKVTTDTVVCNANGQYQMNFCIMSDPLIGWDVYSFTLNPPAGVIFTPNTFTLSSPLQAGQMQCGFTTTVSGAGATDGQTICYTLTGKGQNNAPPILCCTDTVVTACVTLPTCKCDKLSVSAVSVSMPPDSCCWKVTLTNNYSNSYFSGVQLTPLNGVVFGAMNAGAWNMAFTPTQATITTLFPGTYLGQTSVLPTFCLGGITSSVQVPQYVEVAWLDSNKNIVCRDTLIFDCRPIVETDCAVIVNPKIECSKEIPGAYTFSFQVYNNSGFTVNKVDLDAITGGVLIPTSFAVPLLLPYGTSPVLTAQVYGVPANGQFCFYLTVHDTATNGNELNCCSHSRKYCFTVPPCDSCVCGDFNILYAISRGPLLPKRCGDTLVVPANGLILPINFLTSFSCVGDSCRDSVPINWMLTGPAGFTPLSNSTYATPGFTIPISNATFTLPGFYTLMMTGQCGMKQCTCKIVFKADTTCCRSRELFIQAINNAISISVNNALCKATINIGNLLNCDEITNIQWGDGTSVAGPFPPGNMPMHNYSGSGTYFISFTAIERDPVTKQICFDYQKRDSIKLMCNNTDTCRCLGFANMSFYNYTWQPTVKPAKCDSFYTLPCTTNGGPFYFHGNMLCSSKACLSDSVTWSIGQGGIKIASGTVALNMIGSLASGHFDIALNSALFTPGVAYNMTVTGKCGTQVCTCKINFNFAPCPCLCDNLKKDLIKGFKVVGSQPLTICKRTFMPISLCPKDVVTWTLNGVPVAGTTTGNNVKTITFPGSGIYTICMIVVRTDASGKVCEGKICQKVKVKCRINGVDPNIAFCSDNKVLNGDFTEGAIAGHLDALGVISDWKLFPNVGDGFVFVDDSTGSGDAGHLVLNGGKANFGAVWQKVNLPPNTFTTFEYDFKNYLGESTPAGTVLEFRLEPDTLPGGPSQVLYTQSIKDTTTSWASALLSVRVNPNQDYKYLIICVRNDNDTSKSVIGIDNLVICTGSVSGIDQTSLLKKIHIFPNPNSGVFTVELPTPATSNMKLRVTDLMGRLLLEKQTEEGKAIQTVKASTLPDGLYFIQVVSEGKVVAMEKFVKQ